MRAPPELAISVRQPWAWAIIFGGKNVENRTAKAIAHMVPMCGRRAIHAAQGMTREEYEEARAFMADIGVACPPPAELVRGAVIGSVEVAGFVSESDSPWFMGPRALILRDPYACVPIPAVGQLGYFRWKPASPDILARPARWMLPAEPPPPKAPPPPGLFD